MDDPLIPPLPRPDPATCQLSKGAPVTWSNRHSLREVQYRDDANLSARQSIYAYQHPRVELPPWVLDLAALRGDETVTDVGCGNGGYLAALDRRGHHGLVLGLDLSVGMLRTSGGRLLAAADAADLPLPDDSVDVALAAHMLYHVPDPAVAVRELRRITRSGGRVLVVLNGADHLDELRALLGTSGEPLTLDDGEDLLAAEFATVTRHDLTAELRLPDPAPLEAYARSIPATPPTLPTGPLTIRTHTGCLVCT